MRDDKCPVDRYRRGIKGEEGYKKTQEGGGDSRVVPELDLAPVAQLPEPPELVERVLRLGVTEQVHHRVCECIIRVVAVRVEKAQAFGEDVAGCWADVAVLALHRGVFPLLLCPTWLVDLGGFRQLGDTVEDGVLGATHVPAYLLASPDKLGVNGWEVLDRFVQVERVDTVSC